MLSIVYTSAARTPFDDGDLATLLMNSRANNRRLGLSGFLMHKQGRFVQVLEGPDAAVQARYDVIAADPRHTDLAVLLSEPIEERRFADWSMGYRPATDSAVVAPGEEVTVDFALTGAPVQLDEIVTTATGEQRKLEVALLMALDPQVFMFDEPTAGMNAAEAPVILNLIRLLKADRSKTILLVEHKMDVVRELADRIIVLHNGALVADGDPAEVIASPVVQEAYLGVEVARD